MRQINLEILAACLTLGMMAGAGAADVRSLRGDRPLDIGSKRPARAPVILPDEGEFEKSYDQAPPMVPHKVEKTRISLKQNQCLKCHGDLEYKDLDAPKVSDTHFVNRDGKRLGSVSTRYYFCTQCHAPQIDKTPLVANDFQP